MGRSVPKTPAPAVEVIEAAAVQEPDQSDQGLLLLLVVALVLIICFIAWRKVRSDRIPETSCTQFPPPLTLYAPTPRSFRPKRRILAPHRSRSRGRTFAMLYLSPDRNCPPHTTGKARRQGQDWAAAGRDAHGGRGHKRAAADWRRHRPNSDDAREAQLTAKGPDGWRARIAESGVHHGRQPPQEGEVRRIRAPVGLRIRARALHMRAAPDPALCVCPWRTVPPSAALPLDAPHAYFDLSCRKYCPRWYHIRSTYCARGRPCRFLRFSFSCET